VDDAIRELRYLPYSDLGFARVDHHRELRLGLPEAVYGPGKTAEQVAAIVASLLERNVGAVIVTRATKSQYEAVSAIAPEALFHEVARLIVARAQPASGGAPVAIVSAGTADLAVAEEAAVTGPAGGGHDGVGCRGGDRGAPEDGQAAGPGHGVRVEELEEGVVVERPGRDEGGVLQVVTLGREGSELDRYGHGVILGPVALPLMRSERSQMAGSGTIVCKSRQQLSKFAHNR